MYNVNFTFFLFQENVPTNEIFVCRFSVGTRKNVLFETNEKLFSKSQTQSFLISLKKYQRCLSGRYSRLNENLFLILKKSLTTSKYIS